MRPIILKYLVLMSLFVWASCSNPPANEDKNADNEVLRTTIKNTIPENNTDNRKSWQKPDLVIEKLGILDGKTIADIGAGTGYFSFRLLREADKVIAIDIDEKMLKFIEALKESLDESLRSKLETRRAFADNPNLKESEVDMILIVNTATFLADRVAYFSNLKSNLKSFGKIAIVDFKMKRLPIDAPPIDARLPLYQIEQDLYDAGYMNIKTDDTTLDYQYIITANVPIEEN